MCVHREICLKMAVTWIFIKYIYPQTCTCALIYMKPYRNIPRWGIHNQFQSFEKAGMSCSVMDLMDEFIIFFPIFLVFVCSWMFIIKTWLALKCVQQLKTNVFELRYAGQSLTNISKVSGAVLTNFMNNLSQKCYLSLLSIIKIMEKF